MSTQELSSRFKWSKIGMLWPLISFTGYCLAVSVVFSTIFKMGLKSYLPFLATGVIAWNLIQSFLTEGINLFTSFKGIILNIRVPFLLFHLILANRLLIIFSLQLIVVLLVKVIFSDKFIPGIFYLPLSLAIVCFVGVNLSRILSIIGVILKDLVHVMPTITVILSLITPILYPIDLLKDYTWVYIYNPFFYLVTIVREPLLGASPRWTYLLICFILGVCFLFLAKILEDKLARKIVPLI